MRGFFSSGKCVLLARYLHFQEKALSDSKHKTLTQLFCYNYLKHACNKRVDSNILKNQQT